MQIKYTSFIKTLKLQIKEADYGKVGARYRSQGIGLDDATKDIRIVPVNFNTEHKAMLGHCKMILEKDGGRIAINPDKFENLITALRTAVDNDGALDKEATFIGQQIIVRNARKYAVRNTVSGYLNPFFPILFILCKY